jgi:hypothetical protein
MISRALSTSSPGHNIGKLRDLQFVHNVRPAMALAGPPRRSAMPLLMTVGMLVALAVLLMLVLGQPMG